MNFSARQKTGRVVLVNSNGRDIVILYSHFYYYFYMRVLSVHKCIRIREGMSVWMAPSLLITVRVGPPLIHSTIGPRKLHKENNL